MLMSTDSIHHNTHCGRPRFYGKFLGERQMPIFLPPVLSFGC